MKYRALAGQAYFSKTTAMITRRGLRLIALLVGFTLIGREKRYPHDGYIDFDSIPGRGTTFILYFPVSREKIPDIPAGNSIEFYTGHGETVLVVDDVREQRDLVSAMLTRLNYKVDAAASGEAAIAYLEDHRVDLLVLDMIMDPGMDGLDTYRKVVERHPGQKAIIASGFSETERVRSARRLGAGIYIEKPYTLEKIGMAVSSALEKPGA